MRYHVLLIALLAGSTAHNRALAAISYSTEGAVYQQSFNTLSSTNNTSSSWANDTTIPGWNLYRVTSSSDPTPAAVTTYFTSNGATLNIGSFLSFGIASNSDRALGGFVNDSGVFYGTTPNAGSVAGWIASNITNNTGHTLTSFTLLFDGEQWRNGGNTNAQSMVFQYGFGSSFAGVGTWFTPGGNFDWTSPVVGTSPGGLQGNTTGQAPDRGGTIADINWSSNSTLWLRWIDTNDAGNDHGLAIDNIRFSAVVAAVPEASTMLFGALLSTALLTARANRSRKHTAP